MNKIKERKEIDFCEFEWGSDREEQYQLTLLGSRPLLTDPEFVEQVLAPYERFMYVDINQSMGIEVITACIIRALHSDS